MELCHVLPESAWNDLDYDPPELRRDGFLHCCTPEQLDFVLRRHFAGLTDLLVLTFESTAVSGEIRWVHSEPDQRPFPHLYGPIARTAICPVSARRAP